MSKQTEATQYIKATLTAFGPGEAISMTKENWAKLHEAMKALAEQPAQQEPVATLYGSLPVYDKPAQQDLPDLIAGALGVSRGTAYDMMREALAEQSAREWVNLTVDELIDLEHKHLRHEDLAQAIEAKLKEKNT